MDKVALVTGASGNGIGRSAALTLAKEGFRVAVNYNQNQVAAEAMCQYIIAQGGDAFPIQADIFVKDNCEALIEQTKGRFGRIDVCIIGPGAGWHDEPPEKLNAEHSLDDLVQEVKPIYYLCPALIKEMKSLDGGCMIAIATNPDLPSPSYSYNVSKNARVQAMMEMVRSCWKNRIRVNVIAPGPVDHFSDMEEAQRSLEDICRLKRVTPQDIAETIAFLCSEKGRYITGNVVKFTF